MTRYLAKSITLIILSLTVSQSASAFTLLHEIKVHDDSIDALCVKDGYVYTGSFDGTIKRTNFKTIELIGRHNDWVRAILCVGDNIISASNDGRIIIWHDKTILNQVQAHDWWVTDIAFSDNKIVSVSLDETVKVWSYPDLKLLFNSKVHGSYKHHSVYISENIAYIGSTLAISILDIVNFKWLIVNFNWLNQTGYRSTYNTYYAASINAGKLYFADSAGNLNQLNKIPDKNHRTIALAKTAIKSLQSHNHFLYAATDEGELYQIPVHDIAKSKLISDNKYAVRKITIDNNIVYTADDIGVVHAYEIAE